MAGFKCKGGVVWRLLLAGLLLAVAAAGTEVEDGLEGSKEDLRWCKKDCEWKAGEDREKLKECKEDCRRRHEQQEEGRDNHHGHEERCQRRCQKHQDWWRKDECMRECREQRGEDEEEYHSGQEERCQKECQHHRRGYEKHQSVQDCRSRESESQDKRKHHDHESHGEGDRCQRECQHHRHWYEHQQCVRDCEDRHHGGGGAAAGGRGREGDEREHGWETVQSHPSSVKYARV